MIERTILHALGIELIDLIDNHDNPHGMIERERYRTGPVRKGVVRIRSVSGGRVRRPIRAGRVDRTPDPFVSK